MLFLFILIRLNISAIILIGGRVVDPASGWVGKSEHTHFLHLEHVAGNSRRS